jgi:hypothetical protein
VKKRRIFLYCYTGKIYTAKGPKDMYDLTFFLVHGIILRINKKSFIESKNSLSNFAPGIPTFLDILKVKFVEPLVKKQGHICP